MIFFAQSWDCIEQHMLVLVAIVAVVSLILCLCHLDVRVSFTVNTDQAKAGATQSGFLFIYKFSTFSACFLSFPDSILLLAIWQRRKTNSLQKSIAIVIFLMSNAGLKNIFNFLPQKVVF